MVRALFAKISSDLLSKFNGWKYVILIMSMVISGYVKNEIDMHDMRRDIDYGARLDARHETMDSLQLAKINMVLDTLVAFRYDMRDVQGDLASNRRALDVLLRYNHLYIGSTR
jgi:hypothetical protein